MSLMKKYISNWDTLTEEQQKKAEEQFKGNPGLNTAVVHPAAKFFEEMWPPALKSRVWLVGNQQYLQERG